jgi:hypothetical protein
MIRLRIVAHIIAAVISFSAAKAADSYVTNGDFSKGREHWEGDGIVATDPDDKQNPVLKIKLERYTHGISQNISVPTSNALVGGLRAQLINPRTKYARVLVQAWLRLKGKADSLLIGEQYLEKKNGWIRIIIPPVSVQNDQVESISIDTIGMDCDVLLDDIVLVGARLGGGRVGPLRDEEEPDAPSAKIGEPIHLTGHELEAVAVAIADFKKKKYSVSGDLMHYTIDIQRHANEIEVTFISDPGPNGPEVGGGSVYGLDVHYSVATDPVKINRVHFYR